MFRLKYKNPSHSEIEIPNKTYYLRDITQLFILVKGKGKGKAVPLQAWSGPEGSRKLKFLDFWTTAQDGGKVVTLTHRPHLHPRNSSGTHFC
jgi:hypothetical protein